MLRLPEDDDDADVDKDDDAGPLYTSEGYRVPPEELDTDAHGGKLVLVHYKTRTKILSLYDGPTILRSLEESRKQEAINVMLIASGAAAAGFSAVPCPDFLSVITRIGVPNYTTAVIEWSPSGRPRAPVESAQKANLAAFAYGTAAKSFLGVCFAQPDYIYYFSGGTARPEHGSMFFLYDIREGRSFVPSPAVVLAAAAAFAGVGNADAHAAARERANTAVRSAKTGGARIGGAKPSALRMCLAYGPIKGGGACERIFWYSPSGVEAIVSTPCV